MGLKKLIEYEDEEIRREIGEYYIVSKSRMDNIIWCYNSDAEKIKKLSEIVAAQQEEIKTLGKALCTMEEETDG